MFNYRLKFGDMTTVTTTSIISNVYHMEIDKSDTDTIILSTSQRLLIFNTRDNTLTSIAGNSSAYGYRDGVGDEVWFNFISGFTQTNSRTVVVVDAYNNCLRQIDLSTRRVSHYAGVCTSRGYEDGAADQAKFFYPWSVYVNKKNDTNIIVSDTGNKALREVSTITQRVITLMSVAPYEPLAISWHPHNNSIIYISCECVVITVDMTSVSSGYNTLTSYVCTEYRESSWLNDIIFLTDATLLLADNSYGQLYVYNINTDTSYSICTGERDSVDGDISQCTLFNPLSLLRDNNHIYVGQNDGNIRKLSGMCVIIILSNKISHDTK